MMPKTEVFTWKDIDGQLHEVACNVPTNEENIDSLKKYPLFIATINYFATGEGCTMILYISRAQNLDEFKDFAGQQYPALDYYLQGAEIYKNKIPDDKDFVWNNLSSKYIKRKIKMILSGETESGNMEIYIYDHFNFS